MGFPTLEAYIRSLSNDFSIVSKQGGLYVIAKKNEALAHIQDLIQGQNNKKKTSRKVRFKWKKLQLLMHVVEFSIGLVSNTRYFYNLDNFHKYLGTFFMS
jgi:hypothetical protein